jgi:hypothetical protein
MAEPTLVQVFGTNASQDGTTLTITKADLAALGLIASSTNRAESLLVAMLLQAKTALNDTTRAANPDIQISISDPSESLITENNIRYRVASYTIELFKSESAISINPMDY